MNILVFAGTKNGRELILELLNRGYTIFASSLSSYGTSLLPEHENIVKLTGKKGPSDIKKIIDDYSIDLVIDSTHPYAQEISENIISATNSKSIKLIRFDRKICIPPNVGIHFDSMEAVCEYLDNKDGNIFFTTGVNTIPYIVEHLDPNRFYGRVLNVQSSRDIIEKSKLPQNHVIIKNPPYTTDENIMCIKNNDIKYLVTKDSGPEGNIAEKLEAVDKTGIKLLIIDRPIISYEYIYFKIKEVLEYLSTCNEV